MASHAVSSPATQPRREERIGLGIAIAAHVALAAFLVSREAPAPVAPQEERMVVNLSQDVGLADTAPVPVPASRAAVAPQLSQETTAPPEPEVTPPLPPIQQPVERPQPVASPPPRPAPAPQPRATAQPPQPRATPQPAQPAPQPRQTSAPAPRPTAAAQPAPQQRQAASRIGSDFLAGAGSADTQETRAPASAIGARTQASITSAIIRQLKPHWNAPSGVDADRLVTVLSFRLNRDGSLAGTPRVVSQSGITDANSPQKALHAERAIRAVQLAAPFNLPEEYYAAWSNVSSARFDRSLSQ
ncbi:energy transducer TonB [Porphyrobacter sp. GA68]|uniref:energy transducer TonB n=1 Tax=Porphyrobacter sp. GA68 TaxID=2883480 RepID=UPI001D1969D4|nr:energy transducer TonB [Porphyrobacter sp. GA68]